MRFQRDWVRSLPRRANDALRRFVSKARGTSKATRIAIGIALVILYWIYPAEALYLPGTGTPEVDPTIAGSALILLAGVIYLIDARFRR